MPCFLIKSRGQGVYSCFFLGFVGVLGFAFHVTRVVLILIHLNLYGNVPSLFGVYVVSYADVQKQCLNNCRLTYYVLLSFLYTDS